MDISFPTHSSIKKVSFEYTTPESVRCLSVKQVTTPQIFDSLNNPVPGGLYDPAMGPVDKNGRCPTCNQTAFQCPGHFGHIELAVPVYAPMNFGSMYQLLRQICFYCHRLRSTRVRVALTTAKLRLLQVGLLMDAVDLDAWLDSQSESNEADLEAAEDAGISTDHVTRLDESVIIDRLNRHVKHLIQKHKADGTILERKSAALQAQRQAVIDEFLKKAPTSHTCAHCKSQVHGLHRHANTKIFLLPNKKQLSSSVNETSLAAEGMKYMTPIHIYEHLKKVWANEHVLLELLYCGGMGNVKERPDFRLFFTEVISVPPCRFRPPSVFGDSQFDHPQNTYLTEILKLNQRIVDLRQEPKNIHDDAHEGVNEQDPKFANLMQSWIGLQEQVNYLFDSSRNQPSSGKIAPAGIKQILEKKEGLFRKHMMGKRVNFAARSVISPDAQIETSEIGVPLVFAKRLTFPEPVTDHNVDALRQCVINGPEEYPGASHVEMEDGTLVSLEFMNVEARRQLAANLQAPPKKAEFGHNNKKVLRHIRDGDSVIMNRQPTLHKPSMMSHRVKVLQGEKTLRMHYANCNTYNADFDGDEMNLHFPQNQLARAEAQMIANTDRQYLGCTDGSPLRGLIQDHISTGVILSIKDTMFDRDTFQQLLFGALPVDIGPILFPTPAIAHPKRLWTGKQLVSAVLMNLTRHHAQLNLTSNSRCPGKLLKGHPEESQVIVVNGNVLTGIMDKSQFGASAYGITHAVYELYGPDCAGQLLTAMGRLFTRYDQYYGFTCRMDDILLTEAADKKRRQLISASHSAGKQVVAEFCKISDPDNNRPALKSAMERASRSDEQLKALDGAMKGKMNECTSKVIEACLPDGQMVPFPKNNMALMTQTGAKGSMVNFSQISGLLGQQELEGRRVPMMVSGKTLPSFRPWDSRPRAGGYITQRFLTGIRPQEFFFHCMAGREGLIDTAVKTSRSGYLQRCLIKHLEALRVHYDHTVRDDDGSVVQFRYGEDGLDVTKQKYLGKLAFAADNFGAIVASHPPEALDRVDTEEARKAGKRALRHPERHDPVLSLFAPSAHLGAVGEKFAKQLEDFIEKDSRVEGKQFRALMWLKYMRSLADPGEAVGLLAAQSIGEPSTQMTLNTFHFAGFGAKNVTLGIPRLREIIMTASQKIKTPMMTVAVRPQWSDELNRLAALLSRVTCKQLVSGVQITERLDSTSNNWRSICGSDRVRCYHIRINLHADLPVGLTAADVRNTFENAFLVKLMAAIDRHLKRTTKAAVAKADELVQSIAEARSKSAFGKSASTDEQVERRDPDDDDEDSAKSHKKRKDFVDDDDDNDGQDMDASDAKAAARRKQAATYDEGDEDDDEVRPADEEDLSDNEKAQPQPVSASLEEGDEAVEQVEDMLRYSKVAEFGNIRDFAFAADCVSFSLCYQASAPKLLMLDIIERVIGETVVRQVPSVSKAFPNPPSPSSPLATITTEGVNIRGLWEWSCSAAELAAMLDMDSLTSNDICAVLNTFGVEAARATIVSEIAGVFGVYGISVDQRHLSLIADYMTLDGGYRPFNRMGISHSVSPLLKMSFETTVGFLKQAVLLGDHDELETPASRIVLGQPVKLGTGSFEVLQKLVL